MALLHLLIPFIIMTNTETVHSENLGKNNHEITTDLCDTSYSTRQKIHCNCKNTMVASKPFVFKAECNIEESDISENDDIWKSFSSINTIERLTLSSRYDFLTYIPTLAVKNLRDLVKLTIQNGKIENLHSHAFANLTNLEEIKLSGNGIRTLAINCFAHHPHLISITLDNNQITEIRRNVFRRMIMLQDLFLTSNNISIVHDRAFSHLENLKTLELNKNSIFVLTNETFWGLDNLTRLELNENSLEVIGDNTFSTLRNLQSLNLANNLIKVLDNEAFNGLSKLESLSLRYNLIKELTNPILFTRIPLLVVLDVKSNNMTKFSYEVISPIIQNFYRAGSSLNIEDNMFPCDCHMKWILILRNSTKNPRLSETLDNFVCYPNSKLAEDFEKLEKTNTEEIADNTNDDYEYYDMRNMNGKLFYSDIPANILPCDSIQKVKKQDTTTPIYKGFHISSSTSEYFVQPTTEKVTNPVGTESVRFYTYTTKIPTTTSTIPETTTFRTTYYNTIPTTQTITHTIPATQITTHTIPTTKTTREYTTSKMMTTTTIKGTILPKIHRTELPLYTIEATTIRKYPNVIKNIEPTEEMVSDGESSIPYPSKINNADQVTKTLSTSIPQNSYSVLKSKDNVQENMLDMSSNLEQKPPESMSHVHESKTNSASLNSVAVILFLCSFLVL